MFTSSQSLKKVGARSWAKNTTCPEQLRIREDFSFKNSLQKIWLNFNTDSLEKVHFAMHEVQQIC